MTKAPTPCKFCGGPKPPGRGRRTCDPCADKMKPLVEQEAYRRRQVRVAALRAEQPIGKRYLGTPPDGQGWCPRCRQFLALDEFAKSKGKNKSGYCKICYSAYLHARTLRNAFGIDPAEYERLSDMQDGRCAICRTKPRSRRLAVDHDHKTGVIRGLLCSRCNHKVLGAANESSIMLRRAARYLDRPPAVAGEMEPDDVEVTAMMLADGLADCERWADDQQVTRYAVVSPNPDSDDIGESIVSLPYWLFLELTVEVAEQERGAA